MRIIIYRTMLYYIRYSHIKLHCTRRMHRMHRKIYPRLEDVRLEQLPQNELSSHILRLTTHTQIQTIHTMHHYLHLFDHFLLVLLK